MGRLQRVWKDNRGNDNIKGNMRSLRRIGEEKENMGI